MACERVSSPMATECASAVEMVTLPWLSIRDSLWMSRTSPGVGSTVGGSSKRSPLVMAMRFAAATSGSSERTEVPVSSTSSTSSNNGQMERMMRLPLVGSPSPTRATDLE